MGSCVFGKLWVDELCACSIVFGELWVDLLYVWKIVLMENCVFGDLYVWGFMY